MELQRPRAFQFKAKMYTSVGRFSTQNPWFWILEVVCTNGEIDLRLNEQNFFAKSYAIFDDFVKRSMPMQLQNFEKPQTRFPADYRYTHNSEISGTQCITKLLLHLWFILKCLCINISIIESKHVLIFATRKKCNVLKLLIFIRKTILCLF